jgi:hypothetical protein
MRHLCCSSVDGLEKSSGGMTKRLTSDMQAELIAKRLEHFQDSGTIAAAARIPLPLNVLKYDDPWIGVIPFYRNVNNSELPK